MTEAAKDGNEGARPESGKEFTTKAEYNRALVRQENWASAEATRLASREGVEFIKERQRKHTTQGLSRQQAAAVQMKKASESLEAHRQQNLTLGRQVYDEVANWRQNAKAKQEEWAVRGKMLAASIKSAEDRGPAAAVAQLSASKKAQAAATRADDEAKAKALEELRAGHAAAAKERAAGIKAVTNERVIDGAKRFFYERRLALAAQTKAQQAEWEKQRAMAKAEAQEAQTKRRTKVKSVRQGSTKSRSALATQRQAEATAMREEKRRMAEEHKKAMQEMYMRKSAIAKSVLANSFIQPVDAAEANAGGALYSVTNIRSPSPEREA